MTSSPSNAQTEKLDQEPAAPAPQPEAPAPDHALLYANREMLIAEAAYLRAEARDFAGGENERLRDWLEAEAEIDAMLGQLKAPQER